jgi:hypothetical protein
MNISVTTTNSVDSNQNSFNISVQILELHREAPTFAQEFVDFFLTDGSQLGTIVGLVRANSGFKNGQTVYKIVEDSTGMDRLFNISRNVSSKKCMQFNTFRGKSAC